MVNSYIMTTRLLSKRAQVVRNDSLLAASISALKQQTTTTATTRNSLETLEETANSNVGAVSSLSIEPIAPIDPIANSIQRSTQFQLPNPNKTRQFNSMPKTSSQADELHNSQKCLIEKSSNKIDTSTTKINANSLTSNCETSCDNNNAHQPATVSKLSATKNKLTTCKQQNITATTTKSSHCKFSDELINDNCLASRCCRLVVAKKQVTQQTKNTQTNEALLLADDIKSIDVVQSIADATSEKQKAKAVVETGDAASNVNNDKDDSCKASSDRKCAKACSNYNQMHNNLTNSEIANDLTIDKGQQIQSKINTDFRRLTR